ncbi:MAG: [Clostridia bacterium]|nr:[FeFe] hydrogenase, group A [Clostridia bacterium]
MKGYVIVDGIKTAINDAKNLLEVIRSAGIELPTFCYHSELSTFGACRMCIVEDDRGRIMTSCSTIPYDGMVVYTNTPRLRKYRRNILELLLANHDRDCTTCIKSSRCKLQELALTMGVRDVRFENITEKKPVDRSSPSIVRDPNKCIMCGECVRMCEEVQGVGAICIANRGASIEVVAAYGKPLAESNCVNCGQCRSVCPTGALTIKNDNKDVWDAINDPKKRVIVQIAPAVRVAIGEEFGEAPGTEVMGRLVAALRKMGVDEVYDTTIGADLTVTEETAEFIARVREGKNIPLFTSCCPGWMQFVKTKYPELLPNVSTCRSPMEMFGVVIKEYFKDADKEEDRQTVNVAIMPCTAKKAEAALPEFTTDAGRDVDFVLTTQELCMMIKESGIQFAELSEEAADMPFGLGSGAGVIFGVTGGVTESVIRQVSNAHSKETLRDIAFTPVRGMNGIRELSLEFEGQTLRVAIVNGLKNADMLIKKLKSGEVSYDFIEVMACTGGCIGGAGQPLPQTSEVREARAKGLYGADSVAQIKRSEENPTIETLYNGLLKGKEHILHVPGRH